MESSTLFWFMVYYQRMLLVIAVLAAGMFMMFRLSERLERQKPRWFVIVVGTLMLVLIAAAIGDLAEAMRSGKWTMWVVVRPICYAFLLLQVRDRARKAVGHSE